MQSIWKEVDESWRSGLGEINDFFDRHPLFIWGGAILALFAALAFTASKAPDKVQVQLNPITVCEPFSGVLDVVGNYTPKAVVCKDGKSRTLIRWETK